jgi:transposase
VAELEKGGQMEKEEAWKLWVGIDWGNSTHQICIVDSERKVLAELSVPHHGKEIGEFVEALVARVHDPSEIAVAIEAPRGAIIDTLCERGVAVFAINPKQLDRFRDRFTVAGAKDDRRDAYVLAQSLHTDMRLFRRVQLGDPLVVQLRELVRVHEDLTAECNALGNRLVEQIRRIFPQILTLGSLHDERWLWALLERAPTPALAKRLSVAKIRTILKLHRIRRLEPEQVQAVLREKPLHVAAGVTEAASAHMRMVLQRLRLADAQQRECHREMDVLLEQLTEPEPGKTEHRDAAILRSLPGVGTIVSATMLAEATQPLENRDYNMLRAQCGIAPVTKQSGKRHDVQMRRACNPRLRNAIHHATMNCVVRDPATKAHYARLRAKGHSHGRAIRGVADRILQRLVAMLRSRTLYDPVLRKNKAPESTISS